MKKRILVIFSVIAALALTKVSFGQQYTLTDDDVVVENGIIQSCSFDFTIKDIIIPETLHGQTITGIRDAIQWNENGVFQEKGITSVQLPSTIEFIGVRAFKLNELISLDLSTCPNIKTIGIEAFNKNKLQSIDFNNCSSLTVIDHLSFHQNHLQNVDLSHCPHLKRIGSEAFSFNVTIKSINFNGCSSLEIIDVEAFMANDIKEVDLSDCINLKTIGWHAFLWNSFLTDLNLDGCASLTTIEQWAFSGTSINSVDLSSCTSLVNLGYGAFDETQISKIILPTPDYPGYEYWEDNNGNIFAAGDTVSKVYGYNAKHVHTPVTFTITNNGSPIDSARVDFYKGGYTTNEAGMVILPKVLQGSYTYLVSAEGFENVAGELTVAIDSLAVTIEMSGVAVGEIPFPAVRVYPNPGNHHLNISLPADFIEGRVELFDNAGQLLLRQTIAGSRASLYTGSLPSGIYLYRIFSNETIIGSGKWVKE